MRLTQPVFPIAPSFDDDDEQRLDYEGTKNYLKYLEQNNVHYIMTTAGTSQFNLLDPYEIYDWNLEIRKSFKDTCILGLPALNTKETIKFIEYYEKELSEEEKQKTALMLLFPERFYAKDEVYGYVSKCCASTDLKIFLHCQWMRNGLGKGYVDLDAATIYQLFVDNDNFVGIKEENQTLEAAIRFCKQLTQYGTKIGNRTLNVCVAGGDQNRFWQLSPYGATSFLAGIGSFYPKVDIKFYNKFVEKDYSYVAHSLNRVYSVHKMLSTYGWHYSMRSILNKMGFIKNNREPFPEFESGTSEYLFKRVKECYESVI